MAAALTLVEAVSGGGVDNVVLPVAAAALLSTAVRSMSNGRAMQRRPGDVE